MSFPGSPPRRRRVTEPMTVPHTPIGHRRLGLPAWSIGLSVFLFLVGGVYFLSNLAGENPAFAIPGATFSAGPVASGEADPALGEQLVAQAQPACTSCHGPDLAGSGNIPSLLDIESGPVTEKLQPLAEAHGDAWVALWIDGTRPETEGIERIMPVFGEQFSFEEIESIVAYLRSL